MLRANTGPNVPNLSRTATALKTGDFGLRLHAGLAPPGICQRNFSTTQWPEFLSRLRNSARSDFGKLHLGRDNVYAVHLMRVRRGGHFGFVHES